MRFHLLPAPIERFAKSIQIFKHGIIPDRGGLLPLHLILNQADVDFLVERIKAHQLPLFDREHIDVLVLPGADCKLQIPFVADLELRHLSAPIDLIGDKIILPQLRGG